MNYEDLEDLTFINNILIPVDCKILAQDSDSYLLLSKSRSNVFDLHFYKNEGNYTSIGINTSIFIYFINELNFFVKGKSYYNKDKISISTPYGKRLTLASKILTSTFYNVYYDFTKLMLCDYNIKSDKDSTYFDCKFYINIDKESFVELVKNLNIIYNYNIETDEVFRSAVLTL